MNVGKGASDKYYVNEDKMKEKMMSLKGGAKYQADVIKQRYSKGLNERQVRMSEQAKQRQIQDMELQRDRDDT